MNLRPAQAAAVTPKNIAAFAGTLGGTLSAGYVLTEMIRANPQLVLETLAKWGPVFAIAVIAIFVFYQLAMRAITVMGEQAKATQSMADSVNRLVEKDDSRARENELVIGHLARKQEESLEALHEIRDMLQGEKARGTTAG